MSSLLVVTANLLPVMSSPQKNLPLSLLLLTPKFPSPVFGHRRKPLSNSQVEASMTISPIFSLNIIMCPSTRKNILTRTTFFPLLPTKTSNPLIFFIFPTLKYIFQTLEHTFHALKYTFQTLEHKFSPAHANSLP